MNSASRVGRRLASTAVLPRQRRRVEQRVLARPDHQRGPSKARPSWRRQARAREPAPADVVRRRRRPRAPAGPRRLSSRARAARRGSRRARSRRGGPACRPGPAAPPASPPTLSLSSSTSRSATFLPDPGTAVSVARSPPAMAVRRTSGRWVAERGQRQLRADPRRGQQQLEQLQHAALGERRRASSTPRGPAARCAARPSRRAAGMRSPGVTWTR